MFSGIIGDEPADLSVYPPHRTAKGGFFFYVCVSSVPKKYPQKKACAFQSYSG